MSIPASLTEDGVVSVPPKQPMMERAFGEAAERQRKPWLTEFRRGVYIDVRP